MVGRKLGPVSGFAAHGAEKISVHESVQACGGPTESCALDLHSEVITVIEGTVAFEHDGKAEKVGPGGG